MINNQKFPPKVEPAYKLSDKWGGFIFTLIYSIGGLIIAYLLMTSGGIIAIIAALLFALLPVCLWIVMLVALVIIILIPFMPAILLSRIAALGAKEDKSRTLVEVYLIAFSVILFGYIIPLLFGAIVFILSTNKTNVDISVTIFMIISIIVIAVINFVSLYIMLRDEMRSQYFSEVSNSYLTKYILATYKLYQGKDILQILNNKDYALLKSLEKPHKDSRNTADLIAWQSENSPTIILEVVLNGEILGDSVKNHLIYSQEIDKKTLDRINYELI